MITTILSNRARSVLLALIGGGLMAGVAPAAAGAAFPGYAAPASHAATPASTTTAASSASATASSPACESAPVSKPFQAFGDSASYSIAPGGSFESAASGWSLVNSAVAEGNESYDVAGGSHSLAIQPNGSAVSPAFCVTTANPTLRFFAKRTSGTWGVLNVLLLWTDSAGKSHETVVGAMQSGTSWTPSSALQLATTLPLWQAGESLSVKVVFRPEQYGGAWAVDDVFIDPRMR
jgi:hypothetical protein